MRRRPSGDEADEAYSRHKFRYTASSLSLFGTSAKDVTGGRRSSCRPGRSGQVAIQTHSEASVGQQNADAKMQ